MRRAFAVFDANMNGKTSLLRLKQVLEGVIDKKDEELLAFWRKILSVIDKNNDGAVSFQEFNEAFKKEKMINVQKLSDKVKMALTARIL